MDKNVFLLDEEELSVTNDTNYDHPSQKEDGKIALTKKNGVVYYLIITFFILIIIATILNVASTIFSI